MREDTTSGAKKRKSLCSQTIHIQRRLAQWSKEGRKHWDLYRWLMDPFVLCDAIRLVIENAGSAGIDGETCEQIKGKEWDVANELSEELRKRRYRPSPVRRCFIPKKDGRKRPLGIPTIRDRVVQRALALLLEPIYEQVFLPCSYGFRPGKRAVDCVAEVAKQTYSHRHILEADIEGFFDHVSHRKLLGMLKEQIVDPRILDLIREILKAGFREVGKPWEPTEEGTPQGGPLSPLLANLYLHYALDVRFQEATKRHRGSVLLRYADDFVIVSQREAELTALRRCLETWMKKVALNLKEKKTRTINMCNYARGYSSKFDFLGFKFHLRAYKDNPERFWVARQPSESSRKTLRENLKAKLKPQLSSVHARSIVNSVWTGWANYFRYGNSNRVFYRELRTIPWIVKGYLRRKYRRQRHPVSWRRLRPRWQWIVQDLRPIRVIPDSLRQRQLTLSVT